MDFYTLVIVLETVAINTYTTYSCSKKKAPPFGSALSVCIFTFVYSVLLFLIYRELPVFGNFNGKGSFLLCGFLYVIPLKCLFDQSIKQTLIILCSSWIYTGFTFSFAVRVAYLFPFDRLALSTLLVQTLFYLITLPYYLKFVNKIFVYILKNLDKRMVNTLIAISLSCFLIIFLLNYSFVEGFSFQLEFLILFFIIINSILSYKMVYNLVFIHNKAEILSQQMKVDALTQLKNREGLYEDAFRKIDNNIPFTIIFVDLNDFKSVNDCFGHAAGDAYLIEFANTVKEVLKIEEGFYRLHGDEFIFLIDSLEVETLCSRIEKLEFVNDLDGIAFKGLSMGRSSFPSDGNTLSDLLYLADLRMYQVKKERHKML